MPELPEVEILVRHLSPVLKGRTIRKVRILKPRAIRPGPGQSFGRALVGLTFRGVVRRGKYLVFTLSTGTEQSTVRMLGHLGMTGRMYLRSARHPLPRHAAVVLSLGPDRLVFEDVRGFGRMTLDTAPLTELGPEALGPAFSLRYFQSALKRSATSIKGKLLDQSLVAGVGNIYASEAMFRARISPRRPARALSPEQVRRLHGSVRRVLKEAIRFGSTIPLNLTGESHSDGLFYYGRSVDGTGTYDERLRVYGREGCACYRCGGTVRRIIQSGRSTFHCPRCQRS